MIEDILLSIPSWIMLTTVPPPNTTNLALYGTYFNTITEGYFPLVLILCTFVVTFLAVSKFDIAERAVVASFITSLLTITLSIMQVLSPNWMFGAILIAGLSLFGLYMRNG